MGGCCGLVLAVLVVELVGAVLIVELVGVVLVVELVGVVLVVELVGVVLVVELVGVVLVVELVGVVLVVDPVCHLACRNKNVYRIMVNVYRVVKFGMWNIFSAPFLPFFRLASFMLPTLLCRFPALSFASHSAQPQSPLLLTS